MQIIIYECSTTYIYRHDYNGEQKHVGRARDAAMAYDKAIVANQLPYKKLNFPCGMPIEDQSDDDDGYWM